MARRPKQKTSETGVRWSQGPGVLIKLKDNGVPKTIDPSLFNLQGRDQSWNPHADNFITANRSNFSAIDVIPQLVAGSAEIRLQLKPHGVIGAVPLKAPNTHRVVGGLVVSPRFGWNDIGPLLQHIGWCATPRILQMPLVPGSAREVPPWVLAGPILQRFGKLLREINRGFRMHEEVRQTPRGRILWQEYATRHITRGAYHQLPCQYPDLGPDLLLQGYIRWGIGTILRGLSSFVAVDLISRRLSESAEDLLYQLRDVRPVAPDQRSMSMLLEMAGLPTAPLLRGIQALQWLVDERGLGGATQYDGLPWTLTVHELFEHWVGTVARSWATRFGGVVRSAASKETSVPIRWSRPARGSLGSLEPDFVVRHGEQVFIFDAKYKGHFEEFDQQRWFEVGDEIREQHRHDVHQILAYASLYEASSVTAVLVYPMRLSTWERLSEAQRTTTVAGLSHEGRQVTLALTGIPMNLPPDQGPFDVAKAWDEFREIGAPAA